jgi:hypothetical protein
MVASDICEPSTRIPRIAGYYLIHSIDFWEKINLSHELNVGLLFYIFWRMCLPATVPTHGLGAGWDRRCRWADIVAKDLTRTQIILPLYFTIFLNQFDILSAYIPDGTGPSVPR